MEIQNGGPTGTATFKWSRENASVETRISVNGNTITADDLAGPFTPVIPADLLLQAALPALGYTGPLEMFGERFHASPSLLQRLNRGATFQTVGEVIRVPNVPPAPPPAAPGTDGHAGVVVTVSKSARVLRVEGADGVVLLQAPVTVGSEHDPLPIGEWAVTGLRPNPVFHYNPELFWDAEPSHSKAHIQAGPNNPVGVMWIGVTREHYGLHGTPEPSRVGHQLRKWIAACGFTSLQAVHLDACNWRSIPQAAGPDHRYNTG